MLLTTLAYSNTWQVPFLLDDSFRIVANEDIRTLSPLHRSMENSNRPFVNFSFALNYAIDGLDVRGFHYVNLAIHLAGGFFLFGIARRTFASLGQSFQNRQTFLAWWLSAMWLVHPLQTQAVTYINQRYESLMGMAFLGAVYCSVRALASPTALWLVVSALFCAFGMGCKEDMIAAPLVVLWYDLAFVGRPFLRRRIPFYLSLFSTWGILAWSMLHYTKEYTGGAMIQVEGLTPWTYLLSQSEILIHYLWLCFVPTNLCFLYDWPIAKSLRDVLPSFCIVAALFGLTIVAIFRSPKWSFLGGAFFLILAPTSSIVPLKDLVFEHRMYLPLASVLACFVLLFFRWLVVPFQSKFPLFQCVACGIILALAYGTFERNQDYQTEVRIWEDTVQKSPTNSQAWNNLGVAWIGVKNRAAAKPCFEKAVELDPSSTSSRLNLATSLLETDEFDRAETLLQQVLDAEPKNSIAITNLVQLLMEQAKYSQAVEWCERGLQVQSENLELQLSYASALSFDHRYSESIEQSERILASHPDSTDANINMACAQFGLGNRKEALQRGLRATELDPKSAAAHDIVSQILQPSDESGAIEHARRASELEPQSPIYLLRLANLLVSNSPSEAIPSFQKFLEIQPDSVDAYWGLAVAYEKTGQKQKAIESLEKVVKLAPQWTDIREYLNQLKRQP